MKTNFQNCASLCYLFTNANTCNRVNLAKNFILTSVKSNISLIVTLTVQRHSNAEVRQSALEIKRQKFTCKLPVIYT